MKGTLQVPAKSIPGGKLADNSGKSGAGTTILNGLVPNTNEALQAALAAETAAREAADAALQGDNLTIERTGNEFRVKDEAIQKQHIAKPYRKFRQELTVEFNGQTMFSLPSDVLELLSTTEALENAELKINNASYLYPVDWVINTTYLQFVNTDFSLLTDYKVTLKR